MRQQLEMLAYEAKPVQIQRQVIYQIRDLESLSATALYYGSGGSPLGSLGAFGIVRPAKKTEYFPLSDTESQKIGVTHHPEGLGKLKVYDKDTDTEYGVPITDILNKALNNWKIDKK